MKPVIRFTTAIDPMTAARRTTPDKRMACSD
jgi:hypothetical protein